jgi:hypothetical protein
MDVINADAKRLTHERNVAVSTSDRDTASNADDEVGVAPKVAVVVVVVVVIVVDEVNEFIAAMMVVGSIGHGFLHPAR